MEAARREGVSPPRFLFHRGWRVSRSPDTEGEDSEDEAVVDDDGDTNEEALASSNKAWAITIEPELV